MAEVDQKKPVLQARRQGTKRTLTPTATRTAMAFTVPGRPYWPASGQKVWVNCFSTSCTSGFTSSSASIAANLSAADASSNLIKRLRGSLAAAVAVTLVTQDAREHWYGSLVPYASKSVDC